MARLLNIVVLEIISCRSELHINHKQLGLAKQIEVSNSYYYSTHFCKHAKIYLSSA